MKKETIDKIMYDDFLKSVPTMVVDKKNPISAYGSIDVEDLKNAIDRLNKIPTYDELLRENKKQKEIIDKIRKEVNKQYTIMGCEVVENWVLLQILEDKEV